MKYHFNRFKVYSRLYTYDDNCDEHRLFGWNLLLDPVEAHDGSHDLADYMDNKLKKYVISIKYYCVNIGYVCFETTFKDKYNKNTIVTYDGQSKELWKHICDYLVGQISDGWGENGIYVIKDGWIGNPAIHCNCSTELYKPDYYEAVRKAKRKGRDISMFKYSEFENYQAYRQIKKF